MKIFALFVCILLARVNAQGEPPEEGELGVAPVDIQQPKTDSIICEEGTYVNGKLISSENPMYTNCSTRYVSNERQGPGCQTKVEERKQGNITTTVVWKHCKTLPACEKNAREINPRDCIGKTDTDFRVCISCCNTDSCNDAVEIGTIETYVPPPLNSQTVFDQK